MLALCEKEEEEEEKREKGEKEGEAGRPASRERVKVLPRSAGAKEEKRKKRGKRGKDEKRTRTKKKKNEWVSREKRGGRLDVVETTKPKRRIGER